MRYQNVIGREAEIAQLEQILVSKKSEFVALYGRRRVGKSFLVEEVLGKKIVFTAVGTYVKKEELIDEETYRKIQLSHFYDALLLAGLESNKYEKPKNWREAFVLLRTMLSSLRKRRKVVVIDELPWLAGGQSSEMIEELGYFWNSWANRQRNIVLVVLGSATSWMLDNVIHEYGGLHARLTGLIHLRPFCLNECECYFRRHGFHLSRYEIAVSYMALGGVPYYLDKLDNRTSMIDNINRLYFQNDTIHKEFRDVYAGLYASEERYVDIVTALGGHFYGLTQSQLCQTIGVKSGGTLSKMLENMIESDIIRCFPRHGGEHVENVYQLTDFFSHFYLRFLADKKSSIRDWRQMQHTSEFYGWAGEMFELLCALHLPQLKNALRVGNVNDCYTWRGESPNGRKAQVDLVLECKAERTDYLCEMKFSESRYALTSEDEDQLRNRVSAFLHSKQHNPIHSIQVVMVTSLGLTVASTRRDVVSKQARLDDLFEQVL